MFWRFGGYANISTIDTILEKPDFAIEDLLDESDLIQELKQQNSKLIEYLRQDNVLEKLLDYVVAPKLEPVASPSDIEEQDERPRGKPLLRSFSRPRASSRESELDPDEEQEKKRNRYAFVAAEVLSSDTWSIYEAMMENEPLIRNFWTFLKRPTPLDPLQASYFTKVNEALFDKKTEEMMILLRSLPEAVADLLRHVECPMIMDLLLKIIALDRTEGGHGIVEWLYSQDVVPTLLSCLSPANNWVVQTAAGDFIKAIITISANASQNDQQCIGPNEMTRQLVSRPCVEQLIKYMLGGGNPLTVGVGIVIEVIRKNNSDYDPDVGTEASSTPSSRDPIYLGTLLRLFAQHVPDFVHLIMNAPTQKRNINSTFGNQIEPLGFDRFKTCELMAELLHCSNMGLLNEPGSEEVISSRDEERQRLRIEGKLFPHRGEESSQLDSMSARADQPSPEEGRKLEVTNVSDDDGFEEVEPTRDLARETSPELVEAAPETTSAPAASTFLDKEDDEFVDEPLSSPRLKTSDATSAKQQFEEPDLVVAPLSPTKWKADEPATAPTDDKSTEPVSATEPEKLPSQSLETQPKDQAATTPEPSIAKEKEDQPQAAESSNTQSSANDEDTIMTDVKSPAADVTGTTEAKDEPETSTAAATVAVDSDTAATPVDVDDTAKPAPLFSKPAPDVVKTADTKAPDLEKPLPAVPAVEDAAAPSEQKIAETATAGEAKPAETPTPVVEAPEAPEAPKAPEAPEAPDTTEIEEPPEIPPRTQQTDTPPVVGDYLKLQFVEYEVVPTILSFFFSYPWNNFLHNVVYDIVQQVFNGPMDRGFNPTLAISLFEAADVTTAIINGQRASDESQAKNKTRMGYMGHLTLIAEEVVKFTERHPPELLSETVLDRVMDQNWINYVEGALAETRERDNAILGGVRPEVALGNRGGMSANGLSSVGLSSIGGSFGGQGGSSALAEAGLNGGLDMQDNSGNNGIGPFAISAGTLMSGFGSSSDEDDDDTEDNDEDITSEFRAYTDPLNNAGSTSMDPPSVPPPPPPPPPLNIPPSRARLQLAARLAMHQKNAAADSQGENGGGSDDHRPGSSDSPERLRNPFADDDEVDSEDDDDEDLRPGREADVDGVSWGTSNKGSWWRGMVRRRQNDGLANRDDSESDKEDNDEDDEEFGDFAMPEAEPAPGTDPNEKVLLKPLAVHPAGSNQAKMGGFSGLWPFGAKETGEKDSSAPAGDADAEKAVQDVTGPEDVGDGPEVAEKEKEKVQQAVEAKRRTSIEDPDDDEDEVVVQKPAGI